MKNCIIVDSSNANKKVVVDILEQLGFPVDTTSDAFEAITFLKEKDVDIIMIDWNLPEDEGIDLLDFIRTRRQEKNWHVFLYSVIESEDGIYDALDAIPEKYIPQPITKDNVIKAFSSEGLIDYPDTELLAKVHKIY